MARKRLIPIISILCLAVTGCNLLTPLIFVGEHKKTISAEFDKLSESRVAILVWADQSTLFDYPHIRFELATYVGDKLFAETLQRKLNVDVVDPRDVEDYVQMNVDAGIDPSIVGKHFDADYVIYMEVLNFQMRDAHHAQFLHGNLTASVSVHDMRADPDQPQVFDLAPVQCVYPDSPILLTATNSLHVREAMYHKFSELVARKFYEYEVDL